MNQGKVLIFSAPSGSGKTTIVKELLEIYPSLEFSISATSRSPRGEEKNGVDYYFLSQEEFSKKIEKDEFIEWEEVYAGSCYGTLKSEIQRIWEKNNVVVFDIDVVGGVNIKKLMGDNALSIFIMPPSIDVLRKRLINRDTDSQEAIDKRVAKAEHELTYRSQFDVVIVNDNLNLAIAETKAIVGEFLKK